MSRDIADAHPILQNAWPIIQNDFRRETGDTLIITCTHRSVEEQQKLYAKGRTEPGRKVTWVDGVTKKSNHNHYPSRAIDVAVMHHGKITWDADRYLPLGPIIQNLSLIWGGYWSKEKRDYPHIEIPRRFL